MENSKAFLKQNNIVENISFKDGKAHTVKIIEDKLQTIKDSTGAEISGVAYKVIEGKEVKRFFTKSINLIQQLAKLPAETEVIIQMKSKKGPSGFISYFDVLVDGDVPNPLDNNDIPVIED